jgi:hypothetical protein
MKIQILILIEAEEGTIHESAVSSLGDGAGFMPYTPTFVGIREDEVGVKSRADLQIRPYEFGMVRRARHIVPHE